VISFTIQTKTHVANERRKFVEGFSILVDHTFFGGITQFTNHEFSGMIKDEDSLEAVI